MDKSQLRQQFGALREGLSAEKVDEASIALCQRLAGWTVLRDAQTVLTYLAFKNEIDLGLLFDLLPDLYWIVPRIENRRLILHPYDPARLVRHRFGMLEPAADMPVVDPTTLDLALAPGVAFDRGGGRLGFGGGFYDRFLITTPALRVGVTYDECLATEALPCGEHDQRMDWIATPSGVFHFSWTSRFSGTSVPFFQLV
jgi:5-formyltetrahydrofolate cyclo-ligase